MITVEPYGRFGNNVIQLIHAIHVAEYLRISKIRLEFRQFDTNVISLCEASGDEMDLCGKYFDIGEMYGLYPELGRLVHADYERIAVRYLKPHLIHAPLSIGHPFDPDKTLVIHIRGGDIFRSRPHPLYTQPPLDMYRQIMLRHADTRRIVLYEDDKNPVVDALKNEYPDASFLSLPLDLTIGALIEAKYIVSSFGTFVRSILLFNPDFKKVYCVEQMQGWFGGGEREHIARLPGYMKHGEWKNIPEQRERMLTYTGAVLD